MTLIDQQAIQLAYLQGSSQAGATVAGVGTPASVDGYNGAQQVEIRETAGGTATVVIEGCLDAASNVSPGGPVWYPVGYQRVDGQASLARAVGNISVAANSSEVFQVLDPYRQIRARISAIAGGAHVMARVYAIPA